MHRFVDERKFFRQKHERIIAFDFGNLLRAADRHFKGLFHCIAQCYCNIYGLLSSLQDDTDA